MTTCIFLHKLVLFDFYVVKLSPLNVCDLQHCEGLKARQNKLSGEMLYPNKVSVDKEKEFVNSYHSLTYCFNFVFLTTSVHIPISRLG